MNKQSCDVNDVAKAGTDIVSLSCTITATHFYDGVLNLHIGAAVSNFVNDVIKDVNDGVMTAWDAVQELKEEYAALALFYGQNLVAIGAGGMQIKMGVSATARTYGIGAPVGALYVAHGVNNIYEGGMNIYNGPKAPATQGPVRGAYHSVLGKDIGDLTYGSVDLGLSAIGIFQLMWKPGSVQFFREDPLNYERAYKQTGKLALLF